MKYHELIDFSLILKSRWDSCSKVIQIISPHKMSKTIYIKKQTQTSVFLGRRYTYDIRTQDTGRLTVPVIYVIAKHYLSSFESLTYILIFKYY